MLWNRKRIQVGSEDHLESLQMMVQNNFYVERDTAGTSEEEFKISVTFISGEGEDALSGDM